MVLVGVTEIMADVGKCLAGNAQPPHMSRAAGGEDDRTAGQFDLST